MRNALGHQPVAGFEHAVDRERIDGLVVVEIGRAQTDEQRQAEADENGGKPASQADAGCRAYSLTQVTSDQILGMFTFSIETGSSSACARNAGQVEIGLEADVHGERRDGALDRGQQRDWGCGNGSGR